MSGHHLHRTFQRERGIIWQTDPEGFLTFSDINRPLSFESEKLPQKLSTYTKIV